jgi:uncharacterized protein (DUF2141 family)
MHMDVKSTSQTRFLALAMALLALPVGGADELAGARGEITAASDAAVPAEASLVVSIVGFASARGGLAIALFDDAADFDNQTNAIRKAYLSVDRLEAHWALDALPPGEYAVLAYHDRNGNRAIDFRALGLPKEPVAVSNGARRLLGPPRFEDAKFDLAPGTTHLTLELH